MRLPGHLAVPAIAAAWVLGACAGPADEDVRDRPEEPPPRVAWVPTEVQLAEATRLGQDAATLLATTLVRQLSAKLEGGGPEAAITFCSDEALPLTRTVNEELGDLEVRRTSSRLRNPANAPDARDREALAWFESGAARGSLPPNRLQTTGDEAVRYYQPLIVNELCVQCHGPEEELAPSVRRLLQELYPDDRATGYRPGDLRGLIRVIIPRTSLGG